MNQNVVAVIGSLTSSVTKQVAAVLSAIGIPQVSFASTSPDLSNRVLYPYFLRNVPSGKIKVMKLLMIVINYLVRLFAKRSNGCHCEYVWVEESDHC